MKKALGMIAIAVATLSALSATAEAGHSSARIFVSGYTTCGEPIYSEQVFVGYDGYGRALYQYRLLPPPNRRTTVYYGGGYRSYEPRYESRYESRYEPRCEPRYQSRYVPDCEPRYAGGGYYPQRSHTEVIISGSGGFFGYRR